VQLEEQVTARGGTVHWARNADEANAIVTRLVQATGTDEVVKVKSMATQEIGLNEALEDAGITRVETDLAELIVQLGDDAPSHILVPAIHKNRAEIREIFLRTMPQFQGPDAARDLPDEPRRLAMAARTHLRERFLRARVAISGANFAVAETGTLAVVESEGNGRMCLTLPQTLITVMGIEKLVPTWRDLEVFLQLLPRSSTGERMNPYTSTWAGVTPGDGPQEFHLVLLDNGRTAVLADEVGPRGAALHPLLGLPQRLPGVRAHRRARLRLGLPGPIGADPVPAADRRRGQRLAAVRLVAVRRLLRRLPGGHRHPLDPGAPARRARRAQRRTTPEAAAFKALSTAMSHPRLWRLTQRAAGLGRLLARGRPTMPNVLPPPASGWTAAATCPPRRGRPSRMPGRASTEAGSERARELTGQQSTPRHAADERQRGGSVTSAREEVLGRIRTALGERRPDVVVPRDYRAADERPAEQLREVLVDRLEDYKASVLRCGPDEVGATVAAALDTGLGAGWDPASVVVAPGVPAGWRPEGATEGRRPPRRRARRARRDADRGGRGDRRDRHAGPRRLPPVGTASGLAAA
jgi:L-lactate dehydrogenase complex protein LldF